MCLQLRQSDAVNPSKEDGGKIGQPKSCYGLALSHNHLIMAVVRETSNNGMEQAL